MSTKDKVAELDSLSVRELIRQAARTNVPLTQISAAVEKADLINLIIRAGPVMDTYDVSIGVKVHTAESIAKHVHTKGGKKTKKKRRKRSSSSSSRSSRSSRSCQMARSPSRNRRKKKSKSRHRSKSRGRKRSRSRRHGRSRSRSPSIVIVREHLAVRGAGAALPDLVPPPDLPTLALPPMVPTPGPVNVDMPVQLKALPPASAPAEAAAVDDRTIAQAGMAAAAAMGFDVLPKAPVALSAPAAGLRPTINSVAPVPYGASLMPGGRVCIQYLCNSRCDLGTNCPEAHIIDPEEEMRVRARFKEQECHYGGQCTRSGCLFRHPGEKFEEGQLIPEGQQVSLRATPQGMALDFM